MWAFGDASRASSVGWLGVAVLLSLLSGSQMAVLQGRRRIQALATTRILASMLGTAAGVCAVFLLGEQGIVPVVIAAPAATVLVAGYFNWEAVADLSSNSPQGRRAAATLTDMSARKETEDERLARLLDEAEAERRRAPRDRMAAIFEACGLN